MNRSGQIALRMATLLGVLASTAGAQDRPKPVTLAPVLDRTKVPVAGKDPVLHVPAWTKTTLSNGAQLVVSEKHSLPLVTVTVNFVGGTNQFEAPDKTGVASLVTGMLSEGTTTRSGDDLSLALQRLGTSVVAGVGGESGSISFTSTKDKVAGTLELMADMMLHPLFPDDALDRLRARTLVTLMQDRDRTSSIASVVFPKLLYTSDSPLGRSRTEQTIKSITRDDLIAFHKAYFQPGRAVISVVGDITPADAKLKLEKAFGSWPAGGAKPTFSYPAPPAPAATTIYLVDKPGAAQSSFAIGLVGPMRDTPDYYALRVMNAMFGELFQSRINANIREAKGYSYGVSSRFGYGKGPGAFRAGGDIKTAVTDSALLEFMKEIRGIRGERPVTDDELTAAKSALIQSLPGRVGSVGGVGGIINEIFVQGLSEDYYQQFGREINKVTKADVERVAHKYIDPDHLAIVIVGDRKVIEAPLRATGVAPVVLLDADGNRIGSR